MSEARRLFIAGRGINGVALPLPATHRAFWHALDAPQLCAMGRCLIDGDRRDLPDGIAAPLAVWGDRPPVHVAGIDLAEEVTVGLYAGDDALDVEANSAFVARLTDLFADDAAARVPLSPDVEWFVYCEYEKAGYFYDVGADARFDPDRLGLNVAAFPDISSDGAGIAHRVLDDVFYAGVPLIRELDYWHDYGRSARIVSA